MSRISSEEQCLREQICEIARQMREHDYIDGASGNVSARLAPDRIVCTPSGVAKARMTPDQLLVLDLDGRRIGPQTPASEHLRPTSEILMHIECYRQRPDIGGVVHAHPVTSVALTIAGVNFDQFIVPEVMVFLGLIHTTAYATPGDAESRDAIRELICAHDVIMLANHGSLTVAKDVLTAYLRLEVLEHYAEVLVKVRQLGGARPLPAEQIEKLLVQRKQQGFALPTDDKLFHYAYATAGHGTLRLPLEMTNADDSESLSDPLMLSGWAS